MESKEVELALEVEVDAMEVEMDGAMELESMEVKAMWGGCDGG